MATCSVIKRAKSKQAVNFVATKYKGIMCKHYAKQKQPVAVKKGAAK